MSIQTQLTWKGFDLTQTSVLILTEKKLYFAFSIRKKYVAMLDPSMDESGIYGVIPRKKVDSTPLVDIEKLRYVEGDNRFMITHKNGTIVVPFRDLDILSVEKTFRALVDELPSLDLADSSGVKWVENFGGPIACAVFTSMVAGFAFYVLNDPSSIDENPVYWLIHKMGTWPILLLTGAGLAACGYCAIRRIKNPLKAIVYARWPTKDKGDKNVGTGTKGGSLKR